MIILINGPFGVGKTTSAKLLRKQLPHATLFDPERLGFILQLPQKVNPFRKTFGDFQNYRLWRRLTILSIRVLHTFGRTVIIPMTIWHKEYFEEIMSGINNRSTVYCFRLTASLPVLRLRIEKRKPQSSIQWSLKHLDECYQAFQNPFFGKEIDTTELSPQDVSHSILSEIRNT